jgi:hypothetical protein
MKGLNSVKVGSVASYNMFYALIAIIIIISVFNITTLSTMGNSLSDRIADLNEGSQPALIEVTKILYSGCAECYDIDQAMEQINGLNVEVIGERELEWNSPEAHALTSQYGITVLPTIIITGETDNTNIKSSLDMIGEIKEDGTFIFTGQEPPYYNANSVDIVGLVTVTSIVDSSCTLCADMGLIVDALKDIGVTVTEETAVEYDSSEGIALINQFDIQKIPALIISSDVTEYDAVNQVWDQLDAVEKDGFYVLHTLQPPYIDTETSETVGLVDLVNIVDDSCSECYDVSVHEQILLRFGIVPATMETYDISSTDGAALVDKYGITSVPTVILSPEADAYPSLNDVWSQVGTVESDGWFVFRELSALGVDIIYTEL